MALISIARSHINLESIYTRICAGQLVGSDVLKFLPPSHTSPKWERNNPAVFTTSDVPIVGLDIAEYKYKNLLLPSNDEVFKLAFFPNMALQCMQQFLLEILTKTENNRKEKFRVFQSANDQNITVHVPETTIEPAISLNVEDCQRYERLAGVNVVSIRTLSQWQQLLIIQKRCVSQLIQGY